MAPQATVPVENEFTLPKLEVSDRTEDEEFDPTGMGSVEEDLRSLPFANDLTAVDLELEDSLTVDVNTELSAISNTSPSDTVAGEERLNLRGFPTPVLRNSFIQMGIPETLNINRTIVIQGPLVPVLGRAAPGGIQNFITTRPSAKDRNRLEASATSANRQRLVWETTGTLLPKKLWQRWAADWSHKVGPEQFAHEDDLKVSGALTLRHSRAASTLISVDYRHYEGTPTPGIPQYKTAAAGKVVGPYLPLALFNANGPNAGVTRESLVVGAQFEAQLGKVWALRTAMEGWWRGIDQDRYTTSQLRLDTGIFEGTREPRHTLQRQRALATHVELTGRFRTGTVEHKLLGYAGVTWGSYDRQDRALPTAVRDALPLSVRQFDPVAPDYYFPPFDPALYARVVTDRLQTARYTSLEVSDRLAFAQGRTVVTSGLRLDEVDLVVDDLKLGAPIPHTTDRTAQLSYHAGVNQQVVRNRVLLFASVSTAFDPSTPVDTRTGRIQPNETTLGCEGGVKGRARAGRLDYSSSAFLLYNRNISRRNPLYDDPVADANQTQPQLVAAGEERFAGVRVDVRYKFTETFSVALRGVHMQAITTKSPALLTEVGRHIAGVPGDTATVQLRFSPAKGAAGFNWGVGWSYIGSYVGYQEDAKHAYLAYPGYGLLTLNAGYIWKAGPRQFNLGLGLRNAFARNLVASNARLGAPREFSVDMKCLF